MGLEVCDLLTTCMEPAPACEPGLWFLSKFLSVKKVSVLQCSVLLSCLFFPNVPD